MEDNLVLILFSINPNGGIGGGDTSPFPPNTFGNWEAEAAFEIEAAVVKNCLRESLKIFRNVSFLAFSSRYKLGC